MAVSNKVYEAAVKGRADFRRAFRMEREKTKALLAALEAITDSGKNAIEPSQYRAARDAIAKVKS